MFLKWSLYNSTGRPVSASPPQRPSILLFSCSFFCLPSCSATYPPARWSLVVKMVLLPPTTNSPLCRCPPPIPSRISEPFYS
jgi:hypothetical protein